MRDGMSPMQREVTADKAARLSPVVDAAGGTAGLHRPGPRYARDQAAHDARERVEQARAEWIDEMTTRGSASPPPMSAARRKATSARSTEHRATSITGFSACPTSARTRAAHDDHGRGAERSATRWLRAVRARTDRSAWKGYAR